MSIRKAREYYQTLTPQQKHFVDNKTINTTLSIRHWISFLSKTSDFDEYGDKARNTLMIRMILFGIGAVVSIFFAVEFYYLFAITIILGILFFDALSSRREFTRRDMNNYLRLFFMPFLEVIKQKAGEEAKLSASLDFSDPLKLQPQKSEVKVYGRKRYIKLYEPKLIIAGVTLSDGTYLENVLTDEIRVISYTNARGKSKSKTKTLHRLFIRLTIDKKIYKLRNRSNFKDIEIAEDENAYILKLKYKYKVSVASIFEPKQFFNVLGGMYQYKTSNADRGLC